jgi:hypothetical protein
MPTVLERPAAIGGIGEMIEIGTYEKPDPAWAPGEKQAAARYFGFSTTGELDAFLENVEEEERLGIGQPFDAVIAEMRQKYGL